MAAPLDIYQINNPFNMALGYGGVADDGQGGIGPCIAALGFGQSGPVATPVFVKNITGVRVQLKPKKRIVSILFDEVE